jgi:hypothetical protein
MIRILLLHLQRRWLAAAVENARQAEADAYESQRIFAAELARTEARIALAKAEQKMQRYRVAK